MIKLIAVAGATATGKSALAVKLAARLGGEIISGDSAQVYRGMDIGTAKITSNEMCGVPHHLIDVLDIESAFSAGSFIAIAGNKARDIHARGKIPFIAGGTGLYIDALTGANAFCETADSSPEIREMLMQKAQKDGALALHAYLSEIDKAAASEIHPNNVKRVARAIEIYLVTGKTKTQLISEKTKQSEFERLLILLDTSDRDWIYQQINERVEKMFEGGLVQEAFSLWVNGLEKTPTASQAIGYKELFPYFRGEIGLDEAKDSIKQATRNYAKRQVTYFKRMQDAFRIDCKDDDRLVFEKALEKCESFLG